MADDVTLPATGAQVATDEVDMGGGAAHVQLVKLVDATDGSTARLPGSTARGLAVDPRPKVVRLSATPVISTTAYAVKDAVGGVMTFTGAGRAAGASLRVEAVQVIDHDAELADLDLVLFHTAPAAPTDNAAFDPTDAELANVVGVVPISTGHYADLNDNAVAHVPAALPLVLSGSANLFGVLVSRSTPTYTGTGDLTVILTILQD